MTETDLLAGRYRLLRTLGAGGMGIVHLVEDSRKDNQVMALKILKAGDAAALENFKSEFRNIRGIQHPHVPEVYDFGKLPPPDNFAYFTTEFIDGKPLDRLVVTWTSQQLEDVLVKLCRALAFLHGHSLLHRDIKPENVLGRLDANGAVSMLKLLDFGLAARKHEKMESASGTLDYMSPEIIGGGQATVQTDLYAVGMLMFRLATGQLPFAGEDRLAVAKQRMTTEAPPPFRFRSDLPVGLSDVISALIRVKPEERPESARRVIALLNEREGTEFPYETEQTRTAYITSAATVSNTSAHEWLSAQKERVTRGETPDPAMIIAPRGLGRVRLIKEFASELTLAGLSRQLILSDSDWEDPNDNAAEAWLIPDTAKVSRERLFDSVVAARLTGHWIIIGSEKYDTQLARALNHPEVIELQPLSLEQTEEYISATFPENNFSAEFAERLFTDTLGFPAAMQDAFTHLLRTELLQIGLSGWEMMPGSWKAPTHPRVQRYVKDAFDSLPEITQYILKVLGCSDAPLPISVLAVATEQVKESLPTAVAPIDKRGWLRVADNSYSIYFAAVARFIRDHVEEDVRKNIHAALLRAWSCECVGTHERRERELLYHDFKSRSYTTSPLEITRILRAAIDDGDIRWAHYLCESEVAKQLPEPLQAPLMDVHASIEYIEGNLEGAASLMSMFLNNGDIEPTADVLDPLARYAGIEEKLGHTDHAEEILMRCKEALPPGSSPQVGTVFGTLAWIAFKKGDQEWARTLAEEGLVRIPHGEMDAAQALLLNTVATLSFYRGDMDAAGLAWQRCLEVNEHIRDRKGIANMYNNLGVLAAQSGDRQKARALWEKCAVIAHEINDAHRLAGIYNNLGIDSLENGDMPEAEEFYLKALALFRKLKSQREQVEILSNLGELSLYRADYARAQAYLQEAVQHARQLDDEEGQIEPLVYLGKLLVTVEQLENADATLHQAIELAQQTGAKKGEAQAWEGLALLHARRSAQDEAVAALDKAQSLMPEEVDPLAQLHLHLTECNVAAEFKFPDKIKVALENARKVADTKWDPYTEARTLVYGLLFAEEQLDSHERVRVLKKINAFPEFLWKFHWAEARRLSTSGSLRKALDEYQRGVNVLKAISGKLSDQTKSAYLNSPQILRFKNEALEVRKAMNQGG